MTQTNNKGQKAVLLNSILFHEWLHLLLIKNRIYFKSISDKYWKYDEGLVTYFEYYSSKRLNYLESIKNKIKYPSQRVYFIYAIKFRGLMKIEKNSQKRKKIIIDLMNSL